MYKVILTAPLLLSNSKGYPVEYICPDKDFIFRNPTGCSRRTLYTCEPVEDLRYLFKRQAPEGNSCLFSLSPAAAGAPVKSWLFKKKKKAPSTDKENDVVGWFLFEALIELGTSHFLGWCGSWQSSGPWLTSGRTRQSGFIIWAGAIPLSWYGQQLLLLSRFSRVQLCVTP